MREVRFAAVGGRQFPVLISDEKEALLAAKAAGGAIVGFWDGKSGMDALYPARFVVERTEDADGRFLERVVRRNLGLPWIICETERLTVREMAQGDLETVWKNRVGRGFSDMEALEAYTKHQYEFYGYGFWALERREDRALVGVAGVTAPRENRRLERFVRSADSGAARPEPEDSAAGPGPEMSAEKPPSEELELGYHVFAPYRRQGYAREACRAIIDCAEKELGVSSLCAMIAEENKASRRLAEELGFSRSRLLFP